MASHLIAAGAIGLALLVGGCGRPAPGPVPRAELISDVTAVRPGDAFTVRIHLVMAEGWHTYGETPGDAGAPTTVQWRLPEGCTAGPIQWPAPQRFNEDGIVTFGYARQVWLPVTIQTPPMLSPGTTLQIEGDVNWLMCKNVCVPNDSPVKVSVPVGVATVPATGSRHE